MGDGQKLSILVLPLSSGQPVKHWYISGVSLAPPFMLYTMDIKTRTRVIPLITAVNSGVTEIKARKVFGWLGHAPPPPPRLNQTKWPT